MTTLKNLKGTAIQFLDEDPVIGGIAGGTWASIASTNTDRESWAGASGTSNEASMTFGGYPTTANTETFNGSAWTEVNNLNAPRHGNGGSPNGSQTATICFGGTPPNKTETELWDGTNWTEVNDLSTA